MNVMKAVGIRIGSVLALGAVFAVPSELWFWQVALRDVPALVVVYGLAGHLMMCLMRAGPVRGIAGLIVAGSVFGFCIEGVVVQQMYGAFPFQIVWTPLAWHALLSVGLCWFIWRRAMAAGLWQAAGVNAAIGIGVGAWGLYMWHAVDPADGDQYFDWSKGAGFHMQIWLSSALFGAAHAGLAAMGPRLASPVTRMEIGAMLVLVLVTWAAGSLVIAFPVSLIFPILLAFCLWALWRDAAGPQTDWFVQTMTQGIPTGRWPCLLLLPAAASATFASLTAAEIAFEANVLAVLTAVPLSFGLWLWALWRCGRAAT